MNKRPPSLTPPLVGYVDWPAKAIVQQAVGQLSWGHGPVLPARLKTPELHLAYARRAIEHGWPRSVLEIHIEQELGRLPDATPGEGC